MAANTKHTTTTVARIPACDLNPNHGPAYADARVPSYGSWGYVCKPCFKQQGCSLGLGKGQMLVLAD